jgi:hypothetical protein
LLDSGEAVTGEEFQINYEFKTKVSLLNDTSMSVGDIVIG